MSASSQLPVQVPTQAEIDAMTPMLKQFFELKKQCLGAVLFFRMGDFYEIFGEDAIAVAPILELVLTSRERGDQKRIPFCGVPHHSIKNYLLKLLKRGFKVAIADQVEDPAEAKGLVKRDITRIFTPGCIDDLEGLESDEPNYIMGVYEEPTKKVLSLALADLSTGEFRLGELEQWQDIARYVAQYRPKEILVRKIFHDDIIDLLKPYISEHKLLIEALPEGLLRDAGEQKKLLSEVLGKGDLGSQPCGGITGGESLVAGILAYFKSLQASLSQFLSVRPLHEPHTMALSEIAMRDLEIFETARRRQIQGSLFYEINCTVSPMGARFLRYSLANPLLDQKQIRMRHQAVRAFLQLGEHQLAELRERLKHLPDLERLLTRILAGSAHPLELVKVRQVLESSQYLVESFLDKDKSSLSGGLFSEVTTSLKFYKRPLALLLSALNEDPRGLGNGLGIFRSGFDTELDQLTQLSTGGEEAVAEYLETLRQRTGITSLKIKPHKTFGLLIEVTKSNLEKVPADFIRRQTMVNCERFITEDLQELGEKLSSATEQAQQREAYLYQNLLRELSKFRLDLRSVAQGMAYFDLIQSFAWKALRSNYVEPKLADDNCMELKASRHPVVERYVGAQHFVPNDVVIQPEAKHVLITGPNMAGKSTIMRQTAICAILNQIGSYVPAQQARLPVFDGVFTRVGASDDLSRGQSTFMVEMSEAAQILRYATQKSLVILDEVGRGTSTSDGLAIASAILEELSKRVRSYTLFATHYHELVAHALQLKNVQLMQTEVLEENGTVSFTHRLIEGACDSSHGIEVARIAGLPDSVIRSAQQYLALHESNKVIPSKGMLRPSAASTTKVGASKAERRDMARVLGGVVDSLPLESRLFFNVETADRQAQGSKSEASSKESEVLEQIIRLNINRTTPMQALNILCELQSQLSVQATGQQNLLFHDDDLRKKL